MPICYTELSKPMLRFAGLCQKVWYGSIEQFDIVDGEPDIGFPLMEGLPSMEVPEAFVTLSKLFRNMETAQILFVKVERGIPTLVAKRDKGPGYVAISNIRL